MWGVDDTGRFSNAEAEAGGESDGEEGEAELDGAPPPPPPPGSSSSGDESDGSDADDEFVLAGFEVGSTKCEPLPPSSPQTHTH